MSRPELEYMLHVAIEAEQPTAALRDVVAHSLRYDDMPRDEVLHELEGLRSELRKGDFEAAEDAVLDVMDYVTGWCSPHMKL